ncbi:MAG: esterase [Verrucomicrobia bacterium]|nr:esterase [Verrucomicrobiota bacterium]
MKPQTILWLLASLLAFASAEPDFPLTGDSQPKPGVPKGEWIDGRHVSPAEGPFPGTSRDYRLYLPAGVDRARSLPFMVFQDGVVYQAPVVFDNLISRKEIPAMAGVFVKPGVVPAANEGALPRFNRSFEYDGVTEAYAGFLIDEFLPALEKAHGIRFSRDPDEGAIAGNSSGGVAAFLVAWHRPDRFRRVFTGVGTYVGIRGADALPVMVRKMEPKPLKVFLQSGTGDNDLYCGDWWMANQMMERSLGWAGYAVRHAWGEGGHNQKHASQVFPEALRWLWSEKPVRPDPAGTSKWKGREIFPADSAWEEIAKGTIPPVEDRTTPFGGKRALSSAVATLSPDQTLLYVGEPGAPWILSAAVSADGALVHEQRFYRLDTWDGFRPEARSLCVDVEGRLYAATDLGIQICDQAGRVNCIVPVPGLVEQIGFGGATGTELMAVAGGRCFRRNTLTRGVLARHMAPLKPPAPRL